MAKAGRKQPKFEDAIEELESIVEQIESGQIGLEESLTQYERGTKLIGQCRAILTSAEQRIAELTAEPGGNLRVRGSDGGEAATRPGGDESALSGEEESGEEGLVEGGLGSVDSPSGPS